MAVEEQLVGVYYWRVGFLNDIDKMGQDLNIPNREVTKLGFWLKKVGSPTGNVTLTIRKKSDKSLIVSKLWGSATGIGADTYVEVTFDTPTVVNEDALILIETDWVHADNYLQPKAADSDVKANEQFVRYSEGAWDYKATYDTAYRYTYSDPIVGGGGGPAVLVQAGVI